MNKVSKKKKQQQKGEDKLVLTPGGWRPKSKVHRVEPGQHIDALGGRLKVVDTATGKIIEDLGEITEADTSEPKKRDSRTNRRAVKPKEPKKK
jgi:hypothetical protein